MVYPISDIDIFDSFCTDPAADNCYRFANGALPVFLETDSDGETIVRTNPERKEAPYGYLYILYDPDTVKRTVVVRC